MLGYLQLNRSYSEKKNCGDGTDGGAERQTGFRRWITHLQNITGPIKKAVASSFGFHFVQISETRLCKKMKKKNKNKYWLDSKSHRNLEVMRPDNEFKERTSLDMTQKKIEVCYPSGLFFNSDHYACSHLISSHQHWGRSSPASSRRQTGTNWQRLGLSPGEEPPTVGDHICPESPIHGASAPPAEFKRRRKPKAGPATAATPRCHLAADTDVAHLTFRL